MNKRLSENLEYWMTNLPQRIRSIPLIHLAIPGSHDSFTSTLSAKSKIAPDADSVIKSLRFLGPIIRYIIANWSRTQTYMATEQLKSGIRYFDLRIATKENTDKLFIVHGLYSVDVQIVCDDILKFLETHPKEVVILDCQHFYAFEQRDHDRLINMFDKTFGTKMFPYSDQLDYLNLDYMTTRCKCQVIVIYRSNSARSGESSLWPSNFFPTPWPDTLSIPDLLSALDAGLMRRPITSGYISQCVLTPTVSYVLKNVCSSLKVKCALNFETSRLEWIRRQRSGMGGMNIIITDYIELYNCQCVKSVIDLNEML